MCVIDFFFFKQKTAYEMRISDWSSDVCFSDVLHVEQRPIALAEHAAVDGAGLQVEARHRVDLLRERREPGGLQHGVRRQLHRLELLHEADEHRALGAARGAPLLRPETRRWGKKGGIQGRSEGGGER